ncbi:MAG: hypothetical protein E7540_01110 [Ruminococcaceae bacterium]|nr:hypothetical protein [Oscillospiraceae bacterium]
MITLSENLSFYKKDIALAHIHSLKVAFGGTVLAPEIWVQTEENEVCSVLARFGGRIYIYSDKKNLGEIKEFINLIGFSEIFCDKEVALELDLKPKKEFSVLFLRAEQRQKQTEQVSLSALYKGLKAGEDGDIVLPSFDEFAPDVSHRLRHGGAAAIVNEKGSALAFLSPYGGIINGISVENEKRGKGFGSSLLFELCELIGQDIFVCSGKKALEFYIKNGFSFLNNAVIARRN